VLDRIAASGRLVPFADVDPGVLGDAASDYVRVLEHPALPFISLPYEWPFSMLREAACFHLDLHLELLADGATLSDASAYNVQFDGTRPVFIDHLSPRPYREGEFWAGHRQFCEQFLNPLLLRAWCGTPHHAWYRGELEGIAGRDLCAVAPWHRLLSPRALAHVWLPARVQRKPPSPDAVRIQMQRRRLPLAAFRGMLGGLRAWIATLQPRDATSTTWANYARDNTYSDAETAAKHRFVAQFAAEQRPSLCFDLGCNSGDFSRTLLDHGAGRVVGFDADVQALERAWQRACGERLAFTPLYLDARNPSPDQGWSQAERAGLAARARGDAVVALAFEHHLAIAHNVPIPAVVDWMTSFAPHGVVEFVPREDPTVQRMLALRDDIFPDYHEAAFVAALEKRRRIVRHERISASGRVLYQFAP
jgi:ribosomal protein L11 methylase PrmA